MQRDSYLMLAVGSVSPAEVLIIGDDNEILSIDLEHKEMSKKSDKFLKETDDFYYY